MEGNSDINTSIIKAASAALFNQQQILLIKRGKPPRMGQWSLPGGHIEQNELPMAAAQRELLEETGVNCNSLIFSQLVEVKNKENHYEISLFTSELMEKPHTLNAGDDAADVAWVDQNQLDQLNIADSTKAIIITLFSKRRHV